MLWAFIILLPYLIYLIVVLFLLHFFFFFNHHTPRVLRPLYLRCLIKVFITYQNSLNFKISVNVALLKVGH